MQLPRIYRSSIAAVILTAALPMQTLADNNLPDLGGAGAGIVSVEQERALGQQWIRLYRSRVPTSSDPLLINYTEQLIRRLALTSQLDDRRISLVVVENPTMNAFAVPGGVMGVNTGLFLYAESEDQFASVIAHELAHLSQRHFARGVKNQQTNSMALMAAQLASLALMAAAGTEAGLAALSASQALALDNRLRFSRQNEQEADRVGMENIVKADMDPYQVPEMFEQMLYATRYSRRPPEFLLTHPVTESRISDSRNRAQKYPKKQHPISLDFHLMRARIQLNNEESPQKAIKRFQGEIDGETLSLDASHYGLALAQSRAGLTAEARKTLQALLAKNPDDIAYIVAQAEIEGTAKNYDKALSVLKTHLVKSPNNHALNMTYAETLMDAGQYNSSEETLSLYARQRKDDPYVWYVLAEVRGLKGDILGLHKARAEYFILNGVYDKAAKHLNLALKMNESGTMQTAILEERLRDVQRMQDKTQL